VLNHLAGHAGRLRCLTNVHVEPPPAMIALSIGIHCEHSSDEKVKREVTIDLPHNGTVGSAALKSMTALQAC
jgi:hypothetical protein